jgi:hypothetical protein
MLYNPSRHMAVVPDDHCCNLLFEAYGAPGCAYCAPIVQNTVPGKIRSAFAQDAVRAHGTLAAVSSLNALDREGALIDPANSERQARFYDERTAFEYPDLCVKFKGPWTLDEQLDLMEALRLQFTHNCSHSVRARMRIERQCLS